MKTFLYETVRAEGTVTETSRDKFKHLLGTAMFQDPNAGPRDNGMN